MQEYLHQFAKNTIRSSWVLIHEKADTKKSHAKVPLMYVIPHTTQLFTELEKVTFCNSLDMQLKGSRKYFIETKLTSRYSYEFL